MKRFLAVLLTILMIFSAIPFSVIPVFAADGDEEDEKPIHIIFDYTTGRSLVNDYDGGAFDGFIYKTENLRSVNVTLSDDVTADFPQYQAANVYVDLNGHTWTVTNAKSEFVSWNNITIVNGTLIFKGTPSAPFRLYTRKASLNMRDVVVKNTTFGKYGLAYLESYGNSGCAAPVHFSNVRFENCSSASYATCLYANADKITDFWIENCEFINCHSGEGGVFYLDDDDCEYNFVNCRFENVYSTGDGGAIYCCSDDSTVNFTNCEVYRCHAGGDGGFLFATSTNTVFNGYGDHDSSTLEQRSNIFGCSAVSDGGAFYFSNASGCSNYSEVRNFNIGSSTAGSNSHDYDALTAANKDEWGGAICMRGHSMKLRFCDLYDNYAASKGGAVYCGWHDSLIEACSFYENYSCKGDKGNDIYLDSTSIDMKNCTVYTNSWTSGTAIAGDKLRTDTGNYVGETKKVSPFSTKIKDVEDGNYIIYSGVGTDKCLDISCAHGGKIEKENLHIHDASGAMAKVFNVSKNDNGTYTIKSKYSGMVLTVEDSSKKNGANVYQYSNKNTDNQQWYFEPTGDGYSYYLRCKGGQYMDVEGAKADNGTNVYSWEFTGNSNQKFWLKKTSDSTVVHYSYGTGTKDDPYKICTAGQWKTFAINVRQGETYEGKYIELDGDITAAYVPVGYYNQKKAFKGHFNGNNHKVHIIDSTEYWDRGLFSYCINADIKNVKVTGNIIGTVTLGGICACAENTTFKNCTNNANIKSINEKYVAGICALATNCEFVSCTNNGEIYAADRRAGGIVGYCEGKKMLLTNCRNNGYIYAKCYSVGGIVAEAADNITIKKCTNNAKVEATDSNSGVGGMIGCIWDGADIMSCVNTKKGTISSKEYAAGILGWADSSDQKLNITNCANYGDINVTLGNGAGIVVNFNNSNMTVENCFSAAEKIPTYRAKTVGISDGDYVIYSAVSNKMCLDIDCNKGGKSYGDNVQLFTAAEAWANVFNITKDKNGKYIIKSKYSGLTLDVSGSSTANGANILQYVNTDNPNQRWTFESTGDGYFYIRSALGPYMDVAGGKADNGTNIQLYQFNGSAAQKFWFARVLDNGDYTFRTALDENYAVDIENGKQSAGKEGANVFLWKNGEANVFTVTQSKRAEKHTVKSKATGMVWGISNGSTENGANILQWASNNADNQLWSFEPTGDGYYYIRSGIGTYMDVPGDVTQPYDGCNIRSWAFSGATCQKFNIVDSSGVPIDNNFDSLTTGAIASGNSKGTFKNCYYMASTTAVGDSRATSLTKAQCGDYLAAKMNMNVIDLRNEDNENDLVNWYTVSDTGYATPDLQGVSKSYITGKGSKNNPFCVYDAKGLKEIAKNLESGIDYKGKYFNLQESILYTGSPIGTEEHPFKGIFEGNGNTITAQINSGNYTGLFGSASGATIKNLHVAGYISGKECTAAIVGHAHHGCHIDNCHVTASVNGTVNCGGIVGEMHNSVISNCRMDGTLTGTKTVGGIVGWCHTSSKVINSFFNSTITATTNVGGIAGMAEYEDVKIVNCSSVGTLAAPEKAEYENFGGIVGAVHSNINSLTISTCFSKCSILKPDNKGYYIVGNNDAGEKLKILMVYYTKSNTCLGTVGGQSANIDKTYPITSVSGISATNNAVDALNAYIVNKAENGVALTTWSKGSSNSLIPGNYIQKDSAYPLGKGTKSNPYRLTCKEHLAFVAEQVCSGESYEENYFKVTKDIDYTGCPQIGNSNDHPFKGYFDGGCHEIKVNINTGNTCAALFYRTDGATIKNIVLTGSVTGKNCVAGIVGYADAGTLIDNCHVTADITGIEENVGGITGMMFDSTISNCRVDADVKSGVEARNETQESETYNTANSVGGVVGWMARSCKVVNCVKTGNTTGDRAVGGIAGYLESGESAIINCASSGTVTATGNGKVYQTSEFCGGILGLLGGTNKIDYNLSLYSCFSNCKLTATFGRGYIIGKWYGSGPNNLGDLYYIETGSSKEVNPIDTGIGTKAWKSAPAQVTNSNGYYVKPIEYTLYTDILDKLNKFVNDNRNEFYGIPLTDWAEEKSVEYCYFPESFVDNSSLIASVFSAENLPIVITIGLGLVAGVVGVTVMYRKKKKKLKTAN